MMISLLLANSSLVTLFLLPWQHRVNQYQGNQLQRQRHNQLHKQQMSISFNSMSCFCEFCLLLVILMSDFTNGGVQGPFDNYNSLEDFLSSTTVAPGLGPGYMHPRWLEPYFDPSTPRNVTALMGKSAYLSCRVRNLGNKTVSWIRHRDIHILTVGSYTYTSDQRFQATHHQDIDDWTLQIKWAQKRDAGMYECQISTQPVRSFFVRLNVVVPTATILGGPDLHVDKSSTINLTCTVRFSPEPPAYIFWYHHEEVINYDSSRGGVSVITEKGDVTTSFLLIQNADLADSGKYSCAPSNADVASVRVHVLNGEHPEAMQTGTSGCQYSWLTICLLLLFVFCYQHKQQQNLSYNHSSLFSTTTTTTTTTNAPLLMMAKIMDEQQQQQQQQITIIRRIKLIKASTTKTNISTNIWLIAVYITPTTTTPINEKISTLLQIINVKCLNTTTLTTTTTKIYYIKKNNLWNMNNDNDNDNFNDNDDYKENYNLSEKEQFHSLTISAQILYVKHAQSQQQSQQQAYCMEKVGKLTKILPPMLMLMIMSVQQDSKIDDKVDDDDNDVDDDDNNCIVSLRGVKDVALRRHLLSTRKTTKQQFHLQQQEQQHENYVQILMSNSTLFGSVTAALVHLTTWPTVVVLLLLSYIKNTAKAVKLIVVHNYTNTNTHAQNVKSKNVSTYD